jgi:hypothetical protein
MDPMNSNWFYLKLQRQSLAAKKSLLEPFARPEFRLPKSVSGWLIELVLALVFFAVLVLFGVVFFLYPTFLS